MFRPAAIRARLLYFPGVTPKLYKAADVCEATGLQPYVLRSWEKEFPGIGVQKSQDTPRLYRQSDLEQVLRIKQLVFVEGLTLAGARRRLEEASPPSASVREAERAEVLDTLGADARSRIALVRDGLRSILDVLARAPGVVDMADLRRNGPATAGKTAKGRSARRGTAPGSQKRAKRTTAAKRGTRARKAAPARGKEKRARQRY